MLACGVLKFISGLPRTSFLSLNENDPPLSVVVEGL